MAGWFRDGLQGDGDVGACGGWEGPGVGGEPAAFRRSETRGEAEGANTCTGRPDTHDSEFSPVRRSSSRWLRAVNGTVLVWVRACSPCIIGGVYEVSTDSDTLALLFWVNESTRQKQPSNSLR